MVSAGEKIQVKIEEHEIPIELFRPAAAGRYPGLVVIHEIFGLNDDIRRIARRFADEGYVAAAPDLLAGGLRIVCVARAMMALRSGAGRAVDHLEGVVRWLEQRADVSNVGAVGFCMGGGFALLLGTRSLLSAAAVFYGETCPREQLANACPLTGGYGGKDRMIGPKGRRLVETLDELGKEHDIRIHEDAGHSYMNNAGHPFLAWLTRPLMHVEYNREAAEDSWRRMLAFFGEHLGRGSS